MNNAYRPRRTCLSVPGSGQKMIDKAKGLLGDEMIGEASRKMAPVVAAKGRAAGMQRQSGLFVPPTA